MQFALEAVASACPEIGKGEKKKTHDEAIRPILTDAVTNTSAASQLAAAASPYFPHERKTNKREKEIRQKSGERSSERSGPAAILLGSRGSGQLFG